MGEITDWNISLTQSNFTDTPRKKYLTKCLGDLWPSWCCMKFSILDTYVTALLGCCWLCFEHWAACLKGISETLDLPLIDALDEPLSMGPLIWETLGSISCWASSGEVASDPASITRDPLGFPCYTECFQRCFQENSFLRSFQHPTPSETNPSGLCLLVLLTPVPEIGELKFQATLLTVLHPILVNGE